MCEWDAGNVGATAFAVNEPNEFGPGRSPATVGSRPGRVSAYDRASLCVSSLDLFTPGPLPMRLALLACLFLLVAAPVRAQLVVLDALVTDAETGEPLPGATAQAPDGTGVAADGSGRLRLRLDVSPARVIVRFLGYQPDTLTVRASEAEEGVVRRRVALVRSAVTMEDVTITEENPAVNILRQVLARKAELRREIGEYAAEAYVRFRLERWGLGETFGTTVLRSEALTNLYWRAGSDAREEVVARRRVPEGPPFRFADVDAVPDLFFADYVELDGFLVPTPTVPDALERYDVRLGDIIEADGRRTFDIAFGPYRIDEPGLRGRIRVVDSLWVIAEAEVRPVGRPGMAMIEDFEATYRVTFEPVTERLWMPSRFEREGFVAVGSAGVRLPNARFYQTTYVTAHRPGGSGPAWLWASEDRFYSPVGAYTGDDAYARERVLWPRTDEAIADEERLASRPLRSAFWREGILRRFVPLPVQGRDDPAR